MRIDRLKIFLDSMGGGAWSFLVGGVICLVNSVNERDLSLLTSWANSFTRIRDLLFLRREGLGRRKSFLVPIADWGGTSLLARVI